MERPLRVIVKSSGQTQQLVVDAAGAASSLLEGLHVLTQVPTERMKVMVNGTLVKATTDLTKLRLKEDQLITVIGSKNAIESLPTLQTPPQAAGLAESTNIPLEPPGLINLGQTCYLNSSLQMLKSVPEVRHALQETIIEPLSRQNRLARSLNSLFTNMGTASDAITPIEVLNNLRGFAPQFAETDGRGNFAQQDADEAWTLLLSALRSSSSALDSLVDRYMSLELHKTLTRCEGSAEEVPQVLEERVLKLDCNISSVTNTLVPGILANFDEKVEKLSPASGRITLYDQSTRISKLPAYLAVHLVRFYWRRDIQKKAKIMRKVNFPLRLDAWDLIVDGLRQSIQPVHNAARNICQDRDRRASEARRNPKHGHAEEELERWTDETKRLTDLASGTLGMCDPATNPTAIYELSAMITHKGPSADSGHYISWIRQENPLGLPEDHLWFKFDDDKVTTVHGDKIASMAGGGEDSAAFVLMYKSIV